MRGDIRPDLAGEECRRRAGKREIADANHSVFPSGCGLRTLRANLLLQQAAHWRFRRLLPAVPATDDPRTWSWCWTANGRARG
jgi:hypothetical protein